MLTRHSKKTFKILALIAVALIFYNEFLTYWFAYLSWPQLHKEHLFKLPKNDSNRPFRMLLVADPQLIGENDEPWYFSHIARWDSDRYLRSTFTLANSYVKPDATVFLGDLFDEGLKSSDTQYERYFERFRSIFKIDKMENEFGKYITLK